MYNRLKVNLAGTLQSIFRRPLLPDKIKIMNFGYRAVHLVNLFAVLALFLSGNSDTRFHNISLHIETGLLWGGILVAYGVYLLAIRKIRLFDGFLKPVSEQVEEAKAVIRNYIAGSEFPTSVRRGMSRYNTLASYVTTVLVLAFALLPISGVLLIFLKSGTGAYNSMRSIHNVGVAFTIFFLILHLFATASKENRPLLRAVFTNGKVSLTWAKDHIQKFLDDGK